MAKAGLFCKVVDDRTHGYELKPLDRVLALDLDSTRRTDLLIALPALLLTRNEVDKRNHLPVEVLILDAAALLGSPRLLVGL